jgi:hypothetical protein
MKELAFPFQSGGFIHELVIRNEYAAIVKRTRAKQAGYQVPPLHYEVIKIRQHDGWTLPGGKIIEPGEMYPRSEKWGTSGWTYKNMDDAKRKYAHCRPTPDAKKGGLKSPEGQNSGHHHQTP